MLIYFLKQTLGEPLKEAWLEGDLHKRIKDFLLRRKHRKQVSIIEDTVLRLNHRLPVRVRIEIIEDENEVVYNLTFYIPGNNENGENMPEDLLDNGGFPDFI